MLGSSVRHVECAAGRLVPRIALPLLVVAALAAAPLRAEAQDDGPGPGAGTLSLDARGGLAVPAASLMDKIADTGASFGGGVAYHVTPHFALRADVEYQALTGGTDGAGVTYADMSALYATGGGELHFFSPETRWSGGVSLGAGISTMDTEDTLDSGAVPPVIVDLTSLAFRGGMKLAYAASDAVDLYLEPAVYLLTFDRDDTQAFVASSPDIDGPADTGWIVPLQAGVRFSVQ